MNPVFEQRFWKYVDATSCECHLWTGGKDWCGYGMFNAPKSIRAHIFIWELLRGPRPVGYIVSHLCNVPCCVNIDHLTLMTDAENAAYRVACGRARGGKIGSGDFGWSWYNGRQKPYDVPAVRFWRNINRNGPVPIHRPHLGNCWIWTGAIEGSGYGNFSYRGKNMKASRIMWIETFGPIPDGLQVLHKCDVRSCVRRDHLELGTPKKNMEQREERGRGNQQKGELCGKSTHTEEQVLKARELYQRGVTSYRAIGEMIGASTSTVAHWVTRKTWKHI